jgi:hypothetical protein
MKALNLEKEGSQEMIQEIKKKVKKKKKKKIQTAFPGLREACY